MASTEQINYLVETCTTPERLDSLLSKKFELRRDQLIYFAKVAQTPGQLALIVNHVNADDSVFVTVMKNKACNEALTNRILNKNLISKPVLYLLKEQVKQALSFPVSQLNPHLLQVLTPLDSNTLQKLMTEPTFPKHYDYMSMIHALFTKDATEVIKKLPGLTESLRWVFDKGVAQGWSRAVEHYIEQIPASSELSKKARNSLFEEMSQAKNFSAFQTALKQYYQVLKGDKTGRFDPEKARFKSLLDLFESASYLQRSTIKRVEGLTAEKLRAKESEIKEKIQAMVTIGVWSAPG